MTDPHRGGDAEATLPPGRSTSSGSPWKVFFRSFRKHRLAVVGVCALVLLTASCYLANVIAPFPQGEQNLLLGAVQPSSEHLLGTDELGRDYLTELLYAGRISLSIAIIVALLSTLFGTAVGVIAGYSRGLIGELLMRFTDLFLVVPALVLLAVVLQFFGQSSLTVVLALAGLSWTYIARIVRGEVLSLREQPYVDAAVVLGATRKRIVFRHLLPNLAGVISVNVSLIVAISIIAESTLSFLGFGVQPPQTSWGTMLSAAAGYAGTEKVYMLYFPGIAILVTVLSISFIGDGLRDAMDPRRTQ